MTLNATNTLLLIPSLPTRAGKTYFCIKWAELILKPLGAHDLAELGLQPCFIRSKTKLLLQHLMRIAQSMAHPQWWPAVQGHQLPNSLLQQEVGQKAEADIISPQEYKEL